MCTFCSSFCCTYFSYLLKRGTTWNDLQRARNNLKWPTTSKKRPETTYNEQKISWDDLQWARNNLKRPTTSKKQPETTCNGQEITWNDIQRARNDLKQPGITWTSALRLTLVINFRSLLFLFSCFSQKSHQSQSIGTGTCLRLIRGNLVEIACFYHVGGE